VPVVGSVSVTQKFEPQPDSGSDVDVVLLLKLFVDVCLLGLTAGLTECPLGLDFVV
jgi:hypothetical protein